MRCLKTRLLRIFQPRWQNIGAINRNLKTKMKDVLLSFGIIKGKGAVESVKLLIEIKRWVLKILFSGKEVHFPKY